MSCGIVYWVNYRLRCSLNELPDMINFSHQTWLYSRGTVISKSVFAEFYRSRSSSNSDFCSRLISRTL